MDENYVNHFNYELSSIFFINYIIYIIYGFMLAVFEHLRLIRNQCSVVEQKRRSVHIIIH